MAYAFGESESFKDALKIHKELKKKPKPTPKPKPKKKKKSGGGINRAAMQRISDQDNMPYDPKASY